MFWTNLVRFFIYYSHLIIVYKRSILPLPTNTMYELYEVRSCTKYEVVRVSRERDYPYNRRQLLSFKILHVFFNIKKQLKTRVC